jgi:hypothetical protein
MPSDIFQDNPSWSKDANSFQDVWEYVSVIVCTLSVTRVAKRLTRITSRKYVYRLNLSPVNSFNIAVIWYIKMSVYYLTSVFIKLRAPNRIGVKVLLDS